MGHVLFPCWNRYDFRFYFFFSGEKDNTNGACGSMEEHLFCMQVSSSISGISVLKDQVVNISKWNSKLESCLLQPVESEPELEVRSSVGDAKM